MNKEQILQIVENTYKKIKQKNPYENLSFVNELIGEQKIANQAKTIILSKDKDRHRKLFDLLFENNCASAYIKIADYMIYPLVLTEEIDDFDLDSELDSLANKIQSEFRNAEFPSDWGINVETLSNDCVEITGSGGLNLHVIPQENGNYSLVMSKETKTPKENLTFEQLMDIIIRKIDARYGEVNYL